MFIIKDEEDGNLKIHLNATEIERSGYTEEDLIIVLTPDKCKELEDRLEESLKS